MLRLYVLTAFLCFGAHAVAQEEDEPVDPPTEETIQEAADNTDLGNSVDDLLETTLQPAETVTPPPEPVAQDTLDALDQDAAPARPNALGVSTAPTATDGETSAEEILEEEDELPVQTYQPYSAATLRALDKITGRSTDIDVEVGTPIVFGSLRIEMKSCFQTPPELPPESAAVLDIKSTQSLPEAAEDKLTSTVGTDRALDEPQLFLGWMFASSPGLSALEHPVYDVWVISCKTSAPE